jgi:ribonuclease HII
MPPRKTDSPPLIELPPEPTDRYEKRARRGGAKFIAGVDEVGRGPLAGPVVAAAVVFEGKHFPKGLDDSKRLSIAVASRERIDRMNILRASLWAMSRALAGLPCRPDHVLVDGRDLPPGLLCPGQAIIGGDGLSVSIAAASIVAKVTRDRLMGEIGRAFPEYGFEQHMGYSTPRHFAALKLHGPCPHHRQSFAQVRGRLEVVVEEAPLFADRSTENRRVGKGA